jgi:hypothetical protein
LDGSNVALARQVAVGVRYRGRPDVWIAEVADLWLTVPRHYQDCPMSVFERGKQYSRKDIQRELGGGVMDYLPHSGGAVVAGCFSKDLNPEAPTVILPGTGPEIERWGRVFAEQPDPVPVFIKQRSNVWHCMGYFRCVTLADDQATISEHAKRAGRTDVTMVLFLERDKS